MTVDPSSDGDAVRPHDLLGHLRREGRRIAALLDGGPIDTSTAVPTCPDWDVAALVGHIGWVHRWATVAIITGEAPDRSTIGRPDPGAPVSVLHDWFSEGLDALCDTLDGADPTADTWHPFPAHRTVGFWFRRLAHETTIHRVDLEIALDRRSPLDATLASDGIDEYLGVIVPMLIGSGRASTPEATLHVHCTDVDGEWMLRPTDGAPVLTREHAKSDAALRGPAESLLLTMWGRPSEPIEVIGSRAAADAWSSIGGN